ncbi:MAG: hypothetical protein IKY37_07660 [Bacteroidaceae bacterium]|nr:hypothetical protein [Bacteroidaceae bacterium]
MSLNFYRTFLECFLIFQRRIAGYATAKKGKTGNKATGKREQRKFTCFAEREWVRATKVIKRQALLEDNVNNNFERNLNSFSIFITTNAGHLRGQPQRYELISYYENFRAFIQQPPATGGV